jgi:protein SCO1/2
MNHRAERWFLFYGETDMSKNAVLGVALGLLLPILFYLVVKHFSDDAVVIPRRLYADTVITKIENGKEVSDTLWHKVRNITLTNQLGKSVSLDEIKGKVIVADFIFTSCPSICPNMTKNMKRLQDALKIRDEVKNVDSAIVHFLSFTVDPERDSAATLKKYADRYAINHDIWWLLTGSKKDIYQFALEELKMGIPDPEAVDTSFLHTTRFVLLDKDRVVRGYYDGMDSTEMARLAQDIVFVTMEKDKRKKRRLFGN